jgi:hypothetical protein
VKLRRPPEPAPRKVPPDWVDGHPPGREVYSRGPIIRTLTIASLISTLGACVALALTLYLVFNRTDQIQTSRAESAADTCRVIRSLVLGSATQPPEHVTIRLNTGQTLTGTLVASGNRAKLALAYIRQHDLDNCAARGRNVTQLR